MNGRQLNYCKNAKYLGYTLDQEILSNRHIEAQIAKCRKRLNILKYISGRDWGADADTLRTTYISLIRPILEYGFPIYFCASETNLDKLERVQLSAARIITGLRNSCPRDILLFESDLPPLSLRRVYCLSKYFNKLFSYHDQHRTSAYLHSWHNNRRLKKHSPFSLASEMEILTGDVEPHSLRHVPYFKLNSDRVHFQTELQIKVCKRTDVPELTRQMALEMIHDIPHSALKVFTDGSRGDGGISGSGIHIESPNDVMDIKIKNTDCCSVFRSELIAIYEGLQFIDMATELVFRDIWILTDSRASIQHLSQWMSVGDKTSLNILELVNRLSFRHTIHFQWVPSHVGVNGNEIADSLAKTASVDTLHNNTSLTYTEISSIKKMELNALWRVPPAHSWYFGVRPRWCHKLNTSRKQQTALSRFLSGHIKSLTFQHGRKLFPACHWCKAEQASPRHILECLNFSTQEILKNPNLFLDILAIFGFMEMV